MYLTKHQKFIDGRLKHFFNQTQALLKLPEVNPEWKKWLSGPNAYVQFTISHFNENDAKTAADIALMGGAVHRDYIYSLLSVIHEDKNFEPMSMKQAFDKFGPLEISGE